MPSELAGKPDTTVASLPVQIKPSEYTSKYPEGHLDAIWHGWRLSCYLATAQIFLGQFDGPSETITPESADHIVPFTAKNATLERKLTTDDVKPRYVCPSHTFV